MDGSNLAVLLLTVIKKYLAKLKIIRLDQQGVSLRLKIQLQLQGNYLIIIFIIIYYKHGFTTNKDNFIF